MGVFHSALSFETCAGAVVSARVVVVWRGRRSRASAVSEMIVAQRQRLAALEAGRDLLGDGRRCGDLLDDHAAVAPAWRRARRGSKIDENYETESQALAAQTNSSDVERRTVG